MVLSAYSVYDSAVGYTQGMNFMASFLLRVVMNYDESTAKYLEGNRQQYKVAAQ